MDYSQLSDFEINKIVAKATGTEVEETYQFVNGGEDIADHMSGIVLMRKTTSNRKHWKLYDPSNNPADAWPIIFNNCISLVWDCAEDASSDWWNAIDQFDDIRIQYQSNPLRAAMIVFLMMKEQSHE